VSHGVLCAEPTTGSWETFGNGPGHTGYYPATIGPNDFVQSWAYSIPVAINQAVFSESTVYYTTNGYFNDGMHAGALNAATGAVLWKYPLANAYSINPPTYANGRLYFQRGDHFSDTHLWCLNAADGKLIWAAPHAAQWERYLAPTIYGDGIWTAGGSYGGMYGFDLADGKQRFFVALDQEDSWTPTYDDGVIYSYMLGKFKASMATTGSALWSRTFTIDSESYAASTLSILDGRALAIPSN
jgi:outer membrane protein assembly factor BamB